MRTVAQAAKHYGFWEFLDDRLSPLVMRELETLKFQWNRRFINIHGQVRFDRVTKVARVFQLNPDLLKNADEFRDTFMHEIAHVICGPTESHGPRWQMVAKALGARPEACATIRVTPKRPKRAVAECGACGAKLFRRKALASGKVFTHVNCGGVFWRIERPII